MELNDIKKHWENWAGEFGKNLRATTKTSTAKILEIDAFVRAISRSNLNAADAQVLEIGCGNGFNCIALAERFPQFNITGMDYIQGMVDNANVLRTEKNVANVQFQQGNVLELEKQTELSPGYDLIFTDRCLINLNTTELQSQAIAQIVNKVKVGGHLMMIENSQQTFAIQNQARVAMGLEARRAAEFNLFFDENQVFKGVQAHLELCQIEDFISIHDLLLYVLVPMVNGGKVDYEHPIVQAATQLSVYMNNQSTQVLGSFGQNRLYHFKRVK